MYSLAGLFWRNDLGCASVIPSEQTASSYIILYIILLIYEIRGPILLYLRHLLRVWEREPQTPTGRLRLKMQKIHRVNLVRLNLLNSSETIERHWICPRRKPARSVQKKIWRRLREWLSRAARRHDEDSLEIHSPAVESIHSRWIDSTWFSSFIERPWVDSTHKIQRIQV